ncbi:MAG: hypothetical protein V3V33_03870 [Candidatus Lokiarchaeia archaeon]
MKKKDKGTQLVIIGAVLVLSSVCFDNITIIFSILLPFSFIVVILVVIGIIFVIIGGLKKEEK